MTPCKKNGARLPRRASSVSASRFNKVQAAAWLAGFLDGEGCVYFRKATLAKGRHHQHRVVTVTNTDRALIDCAALCFDALGIERSGIIAREAKERRKAHFTIEVRKGAAMWRLRDLVPIQAPEKRRRLNLALESYRGLHCHGCGCLHDVFTAGCRVCKSRRYFRERRRQ